MEFRWKKNIRHENSTYWSLVKKYENLKKRILKTILNYLRYDMILLTKNDEIIKLIMKFMATVHTFCKSELIFWLNSWCWFLIMNDENKLKIWRQKWTLKITNVFYHFLYEKQNHKMSQINWGKFPMRSNFQSLSNLYRENLA